MTTTYYALPYDEDPVDLEKYLLNDRAASARAIYRFNGWRLYFQKNYHNQHAASFNCITEPTLVNLQTSQNPSPQEFCQYKKRIIFSTDEDLYAHEYRAPNSSRPPQSIINVNPIYYINENGTAFSLKRKFSYIYFSKLLFDVLASFLLPILASGFVPMSILIFPMLGFLMDYILSLNFAGHHEKWYAGSGVCWSLFMLGGGVAALIVASSGLGGILVGAGLMTYGIYLWYDAYKHVKADQKGEAKLLVNRIVIQTISETVQPSPNSTPTFYPRSPDGDSKHLGSISLTLQPLLAPSIEPLLQTSSPPPSPTVF